MFDGFGKLVDAINRSPTYFGIACITLVATVALILSSGLDGKAKAALIGFLVGALPTMVLWAITADRSRDSGAKSK